MHTGTIDMLKMTITQYACVYVMWAYWSRLQILRTNNQLLNLMNYKRSHQLPDPFFSLLTVTSA